jgi:hypothetical protein
MQKNIDGVLEIQIKEIDFVDKKKSFKTYFEFGLGGKVYKTESFAVSIRDLAERMTMEYKSESILFCKYFKKRSILRDKLLFEDHIDLSLLKSDCRLERLLKICPEGKLKGKFRLVLILFPYKMKPSNISSEVVSEMLVDSFPAANEDVYYGTYGALGKTAVLTIISFPNVASGDMKDI